MSTKKKSEQNRRFNKLTQDNVANVLSGIAANVTDIQTQDKLYELAENARSWAGTDNPRAADFDNNMIIPVLQRLKADMPKGIVSLSNAHTAALDELIRERGWISAPIEKVGFFSKKELKLKARAEEAARAKVFKKWSDELAISKFENLLTENTHYLFEEEKKKLAFEAELDKNHSDETLKDLLRKKKDAEERILHFTDKITEIKVEIERGEYAGRLSEYTAFIDDLIDTRTVSEKDLKHLEAQAQIKRNARRSERRDLRVRIDRHSGAVSADVAEKDKDINEELRKLKEAKARREREAGQLEDAALAGGKQSEKESRGEDKN